MKYDLEFENMSDEELDDIFDNIIVQLQNILVQSGVGHVLEGELTYLPADEHDTIH